MSLPLSVWTRGVTPANSMEKPTPHLNSGVVTEVRGSVVDVRFDGRLPSIHTVLHSGAEVKRTGRVTAYEDCFRATSTKTAPWYIVPADDKKNAALVLSAIMAEVFMSLKMAYPKTTEARRRELDAIKKNLCK
jgi:hypothetical protein